MMLFLVTAVWHNISVPWMVEFSGYKMSFHWWQSFHSINYCRPENPWWLFLWTDQLGLFQRYKTNKENVCRSTGSAIQVTKTYEIIYFKQATFIGIVFYLTMYSFIQTPVWMNGSLCCLCAIHSKMWSESHSRL